MLLTSGGEVIPRDEEARKGLEEYNVFSGPAHDYKEQVFYHRLSDGGHKKAYAALYNPRLGFGFFVQFNTDEFPCFTEWKQTGETTYALGFEPGTNYPEPRSAARKKNELIYMEAGEHKEFNVRMGVFNNIKDLDNL